MTGGIGGAPITGDGRRTRSRAPARSDGDAAAPAHLPGHRARRPSGGRDRRSLVVRLAAVAVLVPVLGGAVVIDAARDEPAGPAAARPAPPMPAAPGDGERSSTWYCAAGTATGGGMADHSVTIVNPGARDLAASLTVVAGAMAPASAPGDPAGGAPGATATTAPDGPLPAPRTERVDVPAGGRVDVRLGDRVEAPLAAAVVEVGAGDAVVEHRVRGEHGEDVAPCSTFAADTWHFAWGATTRDARDVVVLFNPFPSTATVDAAFTTEEGRRRPVRLQGVPVPGRSVVGIDLGEDVTRSEQVSATVRARSGRVVAERLQQYDGSLGLRGLALDLGAPAPGPVWVFADGEASAPTPRPPVPAMQDGGSEAVEGDLRTTERIVVYNPGDERAEVDVQPVPAAPARAPLPFRVSVGPGAYQVVDYGEHDRIDPGVRHSTVVRSTNGRPVVVERVTADLGPVPSAGDVGGGDPPTRPAALTAAAGARLAAPRWVLPSVVTPGGESTVTYVVVNPGAAPVEVRVDLLADPGPGRPGGAAEPLAPAVVPPGARTEVPLDADRAAAALASVVTADSAVVVEYLVRAADGRRVSAGPGVPVTAGAVPIDEVAGDGPLGGSPPG